jgi:Cys-tRNA(Pro)/Cys-tRNA(Cys) deacylase
MNPYEEKLKRYLKENGIDAEHIHFDESVHSVEDACKATGAQADDFVKTICMISPDGQTIAALVPGSVRASTSRVAKALGIERPQVASPQEALERTGQLVGGTAPFGYEAIFLIDPLVLEREIVYVGGGSPSALTKISTKELMCFVDAQVVRVRK